MMCIGCEEKDERIRQLEIELYGLEWRPPDELRLTSTETVFLQAMMVAGGRYLTRDFLLDARGSARRNLKDDVTPTLVDVKLSHLRTKLKRFDLSLETQWGYGWRLTPESRARLLNWNTPSSGKDAA